MSLRILSFLAVFLPTTAAAQVTCVGDKMMDGTVLISKSFCGMNGPAACRLWVSQAKRDLGDRFVRATNCAGSSPSDVAGCTLVTTLQVICRVSEDLNTSPRACMVQIGGVITDANKLRNCLSVWAFKERGIAHHEDLKTGSFTELRSFDADLQRIYGCLQQRFPLRDQCLYDLAVELPDRRLCMVIQDPYPGYVGPDGIETGPLRKSRPTCEKNVR